MKRQKYYYDEINPGAGREGQTPLWLGVLIIGLVIAGAVYMVRNTMESPKETPALVHKANP